MIRSYQFYGYTILDYIILSLYLYNYLYTFLSILFNALIITKHKLITIMTSITIGSMFFSRSVPRLLS